MSDLEKIEAATQTQAYRTYSELTGAAIARALMGDPSALEEAIDLQKEQAQLVRDAVERGDK